MKKNSEGQSDQGKLLGDFEIKVSVLEGVEECWKEFQSPDFRKLSGHQKSDRVYATLCTLIRNTPAPCFLLPAVLRYFEKLREMEILDHSAFFHFELWLNQYAGLSFEENYQIRAKIAGKRVPRDSYQTLFPIGMGKVYPGSHFVTAHGSPDLDTTIASFWGWIDAFAARVSEGMHLWNVPGGVPESQIEIGFLFPQIFGAAVFDFLAKTRTSLALSSIDLMTQKGLVRQRTNASTSSIDHERLKNAVILIDEQGYYLGDWRNFDAEGVRNVVMLLNDCLRWFENHLHVQLISLFSKETLSLKDLPNFTSAVFLMQIGHCQPAKEFTEKQRNYIQNFLIKVLGITRGLQSTFEDFARGMKAHSLFDFEEFVELVESMHKSPLFDKSGFLIENRPRIFLHLEKVIKGLERAIQSVSEFVERLDIALQIKQGVLGHLPQHISYRDEVEEIRSKIGNYHYLTVTAPGKDGRLFPLGVIQAHDVHQNILGTVSLRDFCNRDETKIPSYLEVISVVDHHKSSLNTISAPLATIADAQSSNVLCAELAFGINDSYSNAGMNSKEVHEQLKECPQNLSSAEGKRVMQRVLQRLMSVEKSGDFFIDPMREFIEYIHFFYGILDDTDLLTKVSQRDIECVAQLINRMKSIILKKEVEVIVLDDIPRDAFFPKKAAERILRHPDTYSLYRKIYLAKELGVDGNIELCSQGKPSTLFDDTKEQNGCVRVGQTKIFSSNHSQYFKHVEKLRQFWHQAALEVWEDRPEIDLHMHMVSTVAGADDLFSGASQEKTHCDELWIWIPFTEQSVEHLKSFLNAFRSSPQIIGTELSIDFLGSRAKDYEQIFKESFISIAKRQTTEKSPLSIAVLKYPAGLINSRKAMISPYLPKKVN